MQNIRCCICKNEKRVCIYVCNCMHTYLCVFIFSVYHFENIFLFSENVYYLYFPSIILKIFFLNIKIYRARNSEFKLFVFGKVISFRECGQKNVFFSAAKRMIIWMTARFWRHSYPNNYGTFYGRTASMQLWDVRLPPCNHIISYFYQCVII